MSKSVASDFIKHISGGNHELFHSNLLAFLAEQCPDYFRAIFKPELGADFPPFCADNVFTEKNYLDISIIIDGCYRLVLENKMKSIPMAEQLDRYVEKANKNQKKPNDCKFILLTLAPMEKCPEQWQQVSYRELSSRMRNHRDMLRNIEPSYLKCFVEDYIGFVEFVYNRVVSTNLFDEKKSIGDFFNIGSDSASDQWIELLKKKMVFSALANSIERHIEASDYIFVGSHIVRGTTPLVEIWFRLNDDGTLAKFNRKVTQNSFWIQISNRQIHRGFLVMNESLEGEIDRPKSNRKSEREKFLKGVYNQCIGLKDFNLIKTTYADANLLPDTADNLTGDNLRGYIYDHHVMVYKIENIEDTDIKTINDLVEKIAAELQNILTNCKSNK